MKRTIAQGCQTARSRPSQYCARNAFLSGFPKGVSGSSTSWMRASLSGAWTEPLRSLTLAWISSVNRASSYSSPDRSTTTAVLARSIVVQVADSLGTTAKDTIDLKPQELVDSTEVSSVVLEPMVFNKLGRPVNGLTAQDFSVLENDVPQTIDMAVVDTVPATYTLLDRQQRQHGAAHRLRP